MTALREMPLFPLGTVLFPGMVLPLHIFEPRYRVMMKECLEANKPFGVVLIEEGHEVGDHAVPYDIGTSAYITHVQPYDDGRMAIQSIGYQRFRVVEFKHDKPYLTGMIEDFPILGVEAPEVAEATKSLLPDVRQYIDRFIEASDAEDVEIGDIPDEGMALALFTAIAIPLPMKDKQKLLAESNLSRILELEKDMLRRELMLLNHMIASRHNTQDDSSFSAN